MSPASLLAGGRHRRTSIDGGSGADRVAAWSALMRGSGRAEIDPKIADAFTADVRTYTLGEALVSRVASHTFRFLRSGDEAARIVRDQLFINVQERGRVTGRLANRRIVVERGGVLVTRLGVPMDLRVEDAVWYGFLVPFSRITRHMAATSALDAKVFEPGTASAVLIGYHVRSLLELPNDLSSARAGRIVSQSLRFLLPHLGGRFDDGGDEPAPEDELAGAVRRFITERLSDPQLGADMICREFALSRSTLYRLLRREMGASSDAGDGARAHNGVSVLIRRLRLVCAHREIAAAPADDRTSLAVIGQRWGMPEERTFRRAFTAEFGYPPSHVRRSQGGNAPTPAHMRYDAAWEIERWFGS